MIRINGKEYLPTIFPDKTSQVWNIENFPTETVLINWDFDDESEVMHILQLLDLIVATKEVKKCMVNIPFCPYARQHHEVSNKKAYSLNTFLYVISVYADPAKFHFTFLDLHNTELFTEYLDGMFTNIIPVDKIKEAINDTNADVILFPDKGARERYSGYINDMNLIFAHADKQRDPTTGQITKYTLSQIDSGKNILVVDDICDGGATFITLGNIVKQYSPQSLGLYITHGIFSRGIGCLKEAGYTSIWTAKGKIV